MLPIIRIFDYSTRNLKKQEVQALQNFAIFSKNDIFRAIFLKSSDFFLKIRHFSQI